MAILGIDEITYGAEDLAACGRFFEDWGLKRIEDSAERVVFECLNGCRVTVADPRRAALPPAFEEGDRERQ